jgi:CPA1 family monovalent cation:H+ antiporter
METIVIALVMLAAVVLSGAVVRTLPIAIPIPLVQIALGAVIAAFTDRGVRLNPEIFFLLFLPPLLYLDGWRISKEGMRRDIRMILQLALGLVIFTVLGMGLLLHWMIPAISMSVAFALAAVVSPTDPIAISSITDRIKVPRRLQHVLEGESLLNDASGLVCFRFAVAAAMTSQFSLSSAALEFIRVAVGGALIGAALSFLINMSKMAISQRFGEEPGSQTLLSLLIPFVVYQVAEYAHCSGILAAVAAGITMSYMELSGLALGKTRIQRAAVWDTVEFALNGVMFVLLGEQLPEILSGAATAVRQSEHINPLWLIAYAAAMNLMLAALRFIWVSASIWLTSLPARWRGEHVPRADLRTTTAISVAGVRGALTLAGVLTLPLALPNGDPFPARDLAIFLAACVIILWLLVAYLFLPRLLRGLTVPPEPARAQAIDHARLKSAEAAIAAIERAQLALAERRGDVELYELSALRATDVYRRRLQRLTEDHDSERETVFALARAREIDNDDSRRLIRNLDLMEERLRSSLPKKRAADLDLMRRS